MGRRGGASRDLRGQGWPMSLGARSEGRVHSSSSGRVRGLRVLAPICWITGDEGGAGVSLVGAGLRWD